MPEIRKDPVSGRWVIIAIERGCRPTDFTAEREETRGGFCPFCQGNEDKTPPEILSYRTKGSEPNRPGWDIRVVPNKFPALKIEGSLNKRGKGIYDLMNGVGAHEVIIETPKHCTSPTELDDLQFEKVVLAYHDRLVDLKRDPRFVYGLVFKNVGLLAGASLEHTHSQIIVTPVVPLRVAKEMEGCELFYRYRGRCLFCDIIAEELNDQDRVVLESEHFAVITPFASRFPFEMWVLPKRHTAHFTSMEPNESADFAHMLKEALKGLELALQSPPYNYILHTSPFNVGEIEQYHWHVEIIPRVTRVAGFEWGTGFYINPVAPEEAADYLRKLVVTERVH